MDQFKDKLELRLEHAATPARVARATRMLADILQGLEPDDEEEDGGDNPSITIIVSNRNTRAVVRVWNPIADVKVEAVAKFIAAPTEETLGAQFIGVAEALATYAREEARFLPSFWEPTSGKRLRSVDANFAAEIERATRPELVESVASTKMVGAQFITSRLFLLGQRSEKPPFRVRLLMPDGQFKDVAVEPSAVALFKKAFEKDDLKEYRVKVLGNWIRRDGKLEFAHDRIKAIGIDERTTTGNTKALLSEPPLLTKAASAAILRALQNDDEDD